MSLLSDKIKELRGNDTQRQFAKRAGVSLRIVSGIESGDQSIKLSTLRSISTNCRLDQQAWLDLLIAWLRDTIGPDMKQLRVEPVADIAKSIVLKESNHAITEHLFQLLKDSDRVQIIKAMQRKEVLSCLPSINAVWDRLQNYNKLDGSNPTDVNYYNK